MTRSLRYLDAAKADVAGIAIDIAERSGSAVIASNFTGQLREKCRRLAGLPGTLGTARPELRADIRSTPCYGYVIFFRYSDNAIEIINVLHGSRDIDEYFQIESQPI